MLGAAPFEIGHDKAGVGTARTRLDAGNDAALNRPALGGIAEIAIAADLLPFAIEAAKGGLFPELADLAQQHLVAG